MVGISKVVQKKSISKIIYDVFFRLVFSTVEFLWKKNFRFEKLYINPISG